MNFTEQEDEWGGLDFDSADTRINYGPNGEKLRKLNYRNARNIRTAINAANRGRALTNVLSNLKITTYILPYSGGVFPAGINRCIGAHLIKDNSVLFFVWNSNGNNQILRYYRSLTDPNNPNGVVQQVMMYRGTGAGSGGKAEGWGWTRNTRITSINNIITQNASGQYNPVTPGDLTYWSDPVPHMIDIDRANICGKLKSWIFYAPYFSYNSFGLHTTFEFLLSTFSNVPVLGISVSVPASVIQPDDTYLFQGTTYTNLQASNNAVLNYIATQINTTYGTQVNASVITTAQGNALLINETSQVLAIQTFNYSYSGPALKMYAYNWYGTQLQDRYFDRCMWQPMNVPQGTYLPDPTYTPNNVQNNVFQNRLLYTYTCASPSAPGLWSLVPINNLQCNGTNNPLLNVLDVNFNDSALVDNSTLVLFNQVWFISRTLNTAIQADQVVIQLDPSDFLDFDGTNWFCHYRFYNNIASTPLDPVVSAQLFDDVPQTAEAELENASLMIEGNVDSGVPQPPNVDIQLKAQITPTPPKQLYNVSGKIRILTCGLNFAQAVTGGNQHQFSAFYPAARKYPFWSPVNSNNDTNIRGGIFHNTANPPATNFPFFGGGMFNNSGVFGIRAGMETTFNQLIPEGGFPVYAAGTDFLTVSRQESVGLPTDGVGALDTSGSNVANIGSYFGNSTTGGDIYSTFNLMLPNGTYIIRLASHLCSFELATGIDKLGLGFAYNLSIGQSYQKTSTNVCGFWNSAGQWVTEKEITITVNNGDIFIGTFCVTDLAPPVDAQTSGLNIDSWLPVNIYLYDSTANPLGTDVYNPNTEQFNGVSVEKALVLFGETGNGYGDACTTDHNGYWFGIAPGILGWNQEAYQVGNTNVGLATKDTILIGPNLAPPGFPPLPPTQQTVIWSGSLTNLYNKTLTYQDVKTLTTLQLISGITTTLNGNSRLLCSTFIKGSVVDQNGNGISGAIIAYQTGRTTVTDINGNWEMLVWGDFTTPNFGNFSNPTFAPTSGNNRIVDQLLFSLSTLCSGIFNAPPLQQASIQYFGGLPYSPTNPFLFGIYTIIENVLATISKFKRGGRYLAGLRVSDYPGRLSTVAPAGSIYIPADTEDLSLYPDCVQPNGQPWPAGSYVYGQPTVLWNFNNTMKPTLDVASYDLMFSPDLFYGNYIQWVLNSVQYISQLPTSGGPPINTAYQNGDAVAVLLDISNIATYNAQNPAYNYTAPTVGYTWAAGDRIRFILDRNQNLLQSPSANLGQSGEMLDFAINGAYSPSGATNASQLLVSIPELPFQIQSGFLVEIYTPAALNTKQTQVEYEQGQHFYTTNPGASNNAYGTTSGALTCGDTYWRGRLILVADTLTDFTGVYPALIEAQDISDFYPSIATDEGRPGQENPANTPLSQKTKLICSGTYLPDDSINGLSTFNPNQPVEAIIDPRYGEIKRLFYESNVLQVVCTGKDITAPINRNLMYQAASNQAVVSLSGEFFNPQNFRIEAKNLGTDFGASVCTNSGILFGLNNYVANAWRWFGETEGVISDKNMITFFKQLQLDGILDAVGAYDKFYEEYILTYWRKYAVNSVPVINDSPGGWTYTFTMPTFTGPFNPITGNLGAPPQVNTQVSLTIVIGGVTYYVAGLATVVDVGSVTTVITVKTDSQYSNIMTQLNELLPATPPIQAQFIFGLPETILWNEGTDVMKAMGEGQVWRGFLDLTPEWWCSIGADMLSFQNGQVYLTTGQGVTPTTQRNTFFGQFFNSIITPVFNGVADKHNILNKVWNALTVWMTQGAQVGGGNPGSNNFFSNPAVGQGIFNTYGQQSRLNAANWVFDENHWSIEFQRDLNDISIPPDPPPSVNPLGRRVLNGMVLRSEALTVELQNNYPGEIVLYAAKGNYTLSAGPLR